MRSKLTAFTVLELLVVLVIVIGLGAIAIPSYQRYAIKSKTSAMLVAAEAAKAKINMDVSKKGTLPTYEPGSNDFNSSELSFLSQIKIDNGNIILNGNPNELNGKDITLNLVLNSQGGELSWVCMVNDPKHYEYVPEICRNTCTNCPEGEQYWDQVGGKWVSCTGGQVVNDGRCECPTGTNWNGSNCVTCSLPRFWDQDSLSCKCPVDAYWNGATCLTCLAPGSWNSESSTCDCPNGQYYNSSNCSTCNSPGSWNATTFSCDCPSGQFYDGAGCTACSAPGTWNTSTFTCDCSGGANWNGATCVTCDPDEIWDPSTKTCKERCPATDEYWNGSTCETCKGPSTWNTATLSCECMAPNRMIVNDAGNPYCACPLGFSWNASERQCKCTVGNWDGSQCVVCNYQREVWNASENKCVCKTGYHLTAGGCGRCSNSTWDPVASTCVCPAGNYFKLEYGIDAECILCESNKVYNYTAGRCECPTGYWTKNSDGSCFTCPAGQYGHPSTGSCFSCTAPETYSANVGFAGGCVCSAGKTWSDVKVKCQ